MAKYREEITISKHISFRAWAKLFKYVVKYWYLVLVLLLTMLLDSFYSSSFIPAINLGLMNALPNVSGAPNIWELLVNIKILYVDISLNFKEVVILYSVFVLVRSLCIFITFYTMNFFEMHIMTSLRRDGFKKIQELSFSYFDKTSSGWLIARLQNDTTAIGETLSYSILSIFWALFDLIFTLITMFSYSWQFSLVILATTPITILIVILFNGLILKYHRISRNAYSYFVGWLAECINGTKTIKSLSIEEPIYNECKDITTDVQKKRYKSLFIGGLFQPTINLLSSITTASLILVFVFAPGLSGVANVALIVIFIGFVEHIYSPIQQLAEIFSDLMATQASVEKIFGLLETKPELVDSKEVIDKYGDLFNNKTENFPPMKGEIEFINTSFSYIKDTEVLHNINIKIKEGTSLAVVGETGSGKSTLVNLLCRFYEPTSGSIKIDNVDYKERSVGWIRSNIGYVQQNSFIFKGTIIDNIRYGKQDATFDEIKAACKLVDIDEFIMKLPKQYDTFLQDGGNELSQGQKQLLSFARAVIRNPRLLILDEATSSIDTETENIIQKALNKTLKGRTSVIIAHRLSTIVDCDRILVMKDGNIIEDGKHIDLMNKKGYYYTLYMNQFKELDIDNQIDVYEKEIKEKGIKL